MFIRILTGATAFDDEIHWIGTGFDSPCFTDSFMPNICQRRWEHGDGNEFTDCYHLSAIFKGAVHFSNS